jgi:hypothetical protein
MPPFGDKFKAKLLNYLDDGAKNEQVSAGESMV